MTRGEPLVPLPQDVRRALSQRPRGRHPGLVLDKYPESLCRRDETLRGRLGEPNYAVSVLEKVLEAHRELAESRSSLEPPRRAMLEALGATTFRARTVWRLTLWLARASTLENAGLCLHPIYGFVYLPGSGLKGMAAAWAHTVWLPMQPDPVAAWRTIEDVFGWAANPERKKKIASPNSPATPRREGNGLVTACAGGVVFHDAWPVAVPELAIDIVNNHHRRYYENAEAPGDWESPVPVYFLAVEPGAEFEFALSPRRGVADGPERVARAREFLCGALAELGAGAKTAAGYGHFATNETSGPALERFDGQPFAAPPKPKSPPGSKRGRPEPSASGGRFAARSRSAPQGPRAGETVPAELLEEKTKKGGWKARYGTHVGPVIVAPGAPGVEEWKPGLEVTLQVAAPPPAIQFRYPPQEPRKKANTAGRGGPRTGRGPRPGGRRR